MSELHPRFSAAKDLADGSRVHCDPIEADNCWEWIETMGRVGFTVTVVELKYDGTALEKFGPPEALAAELISPELGHWDGVRKGDPFKLYFYLAAQTLPAGLRYIKERLAAHGLLALCKVGYADAADKCWRTFYPQPEQVGT